MKIMSFCSLFILALFYQTQIYADNQLFLPHLYFDGYTGNSFSSGSGAMLLPVFLNTNNVMFLYGQLNYLQGQSAENYTMDSTGIGYRKLLSNNNMFGAYLLANYSKYPLEINCWELNPGIEFLGKTWELRTNAYMPVGKNTWSIEGWADQFNIYSYVEFNKHQQWDRWTKITYQRKNAVGYDAEIGRKIFESKNVTIKSYLGVYHYNSNNYNNLEGVTARLTFQPKNYLIFSINGGYDKHIHKTLTFGVSINLNTIFNQRKVNLKNSFAPNLLTSNIERKTKIFSLQSNAPKIINKIQIKEKGLERDNIYFFKNPTNTFHDTNNEDGTYEHPFNEFNQKKINFINKQASNANLYLNSGSYENPKTIVLFNGQSIWGRNNDYKEPAQNNQRPLLIGTFALNGNNLLDSIRLQNIDNTNNLPAIKIANNADNININNVQIGDRFSTNSNYNTGIEANNANDIIINNSQIYVFADQENAIGIYANHIDNLNVFNSTIIAEAKNSSKNDQLGNAYGILIGKDNFSISDYKTAEIVGNNLQIDNSTIIGKGFSDDGKNSGNGYGILIGYGNGYINNGGNLSIHNNTIDISNSELSGYGDGGSAQSGNGYGMLIGYGNATTFGSGYSNMSIYNNKIDINSSIFLGMGNAPNKLAELSGNSYGLAIGYSNALTTTEEPGSSTNLSIYDNTLNIAKSSLIGKSYDGSVDGGNAYGLLLGFNEALPATEDENTNNNLDIYNNSIKTTESSLLGQTVSIGHYGGSGYGLLFGYNIANPTADYSNSSNNLNIHNNFIELTADNIGGKSIGDFPSSSNGYGVSIGYGTSIPYINNQNAYNFMTIHNNELQISHSNLFGSGNSNNANDGNSYGLLIGFGLASAYNFTASLNDFSIYQNTIDLFMDKLQSSSLLYGNSYGYLLGYDSHNDMYDDPSHINILNNKINITNSIIQAVSMGSSGTAYGIAVGLNGAFATQNPNNLTIISDSIYIDANNKDAFGIKMEQNSGNMEFSDTNFFRMDNSKNGAKMYFPDGTIVNW